MIKQLLGDMLGEDICGLICQSDKMKMNTTHREVTGCGVELEKDQRYLGVVGIKGCG